MGHVNLLSIADQDHGCNYEPIIEHLSNCADGHPGLPVGDACYGYSPEMLSEMHDEWHKAGPDTEKNFFKKS